MSNVSHVAAAFSSSSLSVAASAETSSVVLRHLSSPRFVAKSPSLLKANQGTADATAIRGPVPPCSFTLRGKGRTREQANADGDNAVKVHAKPNPRRVIRVDTGEGYSPRLRMMSGERFNQDDNATTTATSAAVTGSAAAVEQASPVLSVEPSHSAAAFGGLNDAVCGAEGKITSHDKGATSTRRRDKHEAWERNPPLDGAADIMKGTIWGSQARAKVPSPPQTRERSSKTTEGCLCRRLWTGTTAAPRQDAIRPRILFLVSGQQQSPKKEESISTCTRSKHKEGSLHHERSHVGEAPVVVSLPPPVKARTYNERGKRTQLGGSRCGCVGGNGPSRVEGTGACKDAELSPRRSPTGSDGRGFCDVETTAATDGKGGDSARRVVHVRVPPTPLLVVRSVLPAVEQT